MKIDVKWKVLAFFIFLIIAIVSAGGLDYILSNIPTEEQPYSNSHQVNGSVDDPANNSDVIVSNDWYYKDKDIEISIEMVIENDVTFYVADVKISDSKYLKSAFANNKFGRNNKSRTSSIAANNNAIFAVNGDYYGARDYGIIVRNGIIYRNKPKQEMMAIFKNGSMKVYKEKEIDEDDLTQMLEDGLYHTFSFGPGLVKEGKAVEDFSKYSIAVKNPRTGFGIIEPLHYIFITVDARQEGYSVGMTLNEFANEFVKRGCQYAYNLDGGGTATMYFNGRVVNRPCDIGGERKVSDILYIGR